MGPGEDDGLVAGSDAVEGLVRRRREGEPCVRRPLIALVRGRRGIGQRGLDGADRGDRKRRLGHVTSLAAETWPRSPRGTPWCLALRRCGLELDSRRAQSALANRPGRVVLGPVGAVGQFTVENLEALLDGRVETLDGPAAGLHPKLAPQDLALAGEAEAVAKDRILDEPPAHGDRPYFALQGRRRPPRTPRPRGLDPPLAPRRLRRAPRLNACRSHPVRARRHS